MPEVPTTCAPLLCGAAGACSSEGARAVARWAAGTRDQPPLGVQHWPPI